MLSHCLSFIGGVAMLFVAVWGVVAWVTGFRYLQEALLLGEPVYIFNRIKMSGTAYAMMFIVVSLLALVASWWLFRLAFERDDSGNSLPGPKIGASPGLKKMRGRTPNKDGGGDEAKQQS